MLMTDRALMIPIPAITDTEVKRTARKSATDAERAVSSWRRSAAVALYVVTWFTVLVGFL